MNYSLNIGEWNSVFAVPSSIVDKYIKLADGNSLKLMLFLLRNGGKIHSERELTEALGFRSAGELEDAAQFWIQRGIIRMQDGGLLPVGEAVQASLISPSPVVPERTTARKVSRSDGSIIYTAAEIAGRIKEDSGIKYLFDEAQRLLERPLKQTENRMVLSLTDHYGLPPEVAVLLLSYCVKIGKTTPSYIQTIAKSWSENGIITFDSANAEIKVLEGRHTVVEELRRALDMKTAFSQHQIEFIRTWTEEWQFSLEMILLAHEYTLNSTGNMSFPYTNKILSTWKDEGVRTKDAAEKRNSEFKSRSAAPKAFADSSLDMEDIDMQVLNKYKKTGVNNQ